MHAQLSARLQDGDKIESVIKDIKGCYPSMPKEAIRFAMRKIATDVRRERGYNGVTVPRWSTTRPCSWIKPRCAKSVWISFAVMLDVLEFALPTHAISWDFEHGFSWDDTGCRTDCSWFGFKIAVKAGASFSKEESTLHSLHSIESKGRAPPS